MQSFSAEVIYMETSVHDQHGRAIEDVFTVLARKVLTERMAESENSQTSAVADQSISRSKRYTLSLSRLKRKEKVHIAITLFSYILNTL